MAGEGFLRVRQGVASGDLGLRSGTGPRPSGIWVGSGQGQVPDLLVLEIGGQATGGQKSYI